MYNIHTPKKYMCHMLLCWFINGYRALYKKKSSLLFSFCFFSPWNSFLQGLHFILSSYSSLSSLSSSFGGFAMSSLHLITWYFWVSSLSFLCALQCLHFLFFVLLSVFTVLSLCFWVFHFPIFVLVSLSFCAVSYTHLTLPTMAVV